LFEIPPLLRCGRNDTSRKTHREHNSDPFRYFLPIEGCRSVIVLGTPSPQEALSMNTAEYTENRNEMLSKMTNIAKEVEKRIKKDGYNKFLHGGVSHVQTHCHLVPVVAGFTRLIFVVKNPKYEYVLFLDSPHPPIHP
jgi:hypothetical protein